MKKHTSFKEELRKSLISHALVPCILSILVTIVAFTVIGFRLTAKKNIKANEAFTMQFTEVMAEYTKKVDEISSTISVEYFREQPRYRIDEISDIYQFLNRQEIRGEFYLFNAAYNLLFSTDQDSVIESYMKNQLIWNKDDKDSWGEMVIMYDDWNLRRKTSPSCIIFQKIKSESVITGYCGFVISADCFDNSQDTQNFSLIVTNRFNRVFTTGVSKKFLNERGKLRPDFKQEKGLFYMGGYWYFVAPAEAFGGDVKIFAVSDCTVFMQLIIISVVIEAVLSVIMIYSICMSARTIATKKTDMMYDLIEALEKVEKGNFDIKLNIQSNDEFEMIGNSFNMMLGSIKHLISRHQELARENTLATVQALESQFNPHFLFNNLESIRYMIEFEPKTAEKMIVSLSKLLRYSIQEGDETVALGEEIGFADKYLQIMVYRYGERLKYRIEMDDKLQEIKVPRMILQPLLENSILYGLGDEESITVTVCVTVRNGELELIIRDNGKGIEGELLENLKENLKSRHNCTNHIGLYNVHRRIYLLYGRRYGVDIESKLGEGTTVRLLIPTERTDGRDKEESVIIS